jgi:DNA polymerase-3 subunit alpha
MTAPFVHLHVHTEYSLSPSTVRLRALAERCVELGMPAVACTDHGNMSAAVQFYETMLSHGVKPLIGCEFEVEGFHLLLLAQNFEGYQSLCRLNTAVWLEGQGGKPRVDKTQLAQHATGVLALFGCIQRERAVDVEALTAELVKDYQAIFGAGQFILEIQDHGLECERTVNRRIFELADELDVPVVATNNVHYLEREDAGTHDVLTCIRHNKKLADKDRPRLPNSEFYFKSPKEMEAVFYGRPDVLTNTLAIAERCNLELRLERGSTNHHPVFPTPAETSRADNLKKICMGAVPSRYGFNPVSVCDASERVVLQRLNEELDIITTAGAANYFLIVWDIVRFARGQGIPVGPGRGSAAGSLVAYLTGITDIDPLRYGLLLEPFLNPDRGNLPDFDIDLCMRRRPEVRAYIHKKYGDDRVAQIATFGTLRTRAVIKDVARTMQVASDDLNQLTKLIPAGPWITLESALKESKELQGMANQEARVRAVLKHAMVLEGLNRDMSIHAAGVIIGDQPLANLAPLTCDADGKRLAQYSSVDCEKIGLLKLDFLGLRALTVMQDTVDLIWENHGVELDMNNLSSHDGKTFELISRGDTESVFQLESEGMRDLCQRLEVERLEDLMAVVALYRPGLMQNIEDFIERKSGKQQINYGLDSLKPILKETYGIMLYHEQIIQVLHTLAGFTFAQADLARRALGKKKSPDLERFFDQFMKGCSKTGIEKGTGKNAWRQIAKSAGHSFNKAYAAAYATIAYRVAYLKAHYPAEFRQAQGRQK